MGNKTAAAVNKLIEDSRRNAAILAELKGEPDIVCMDCLLEDMRDYLQYQKEVGEELLVDADEDANYIAQELEHIEYLLVNVAHQLKRRAPQHS